MLEIKFDAANPDAVEDAAVLLRFLRSPAWFDREKPDAPLGSARSTAAAGMSTSAPAGLSDSSPLNTLAAHVQELAAEVDAEGYPWDERIHSGAKSKTAAGLWTRRRNVPDEHYERIKADLRAAMGQDGALPQFGAAAAQTVQSVPPPPATTQHVPPPPVATVPAPPQPDERVPAPPQPDERVPAPPSHLTSGGNPAVLLIQRVSQGIRDNRWTNDTISQLVMSLGLPGVAKLSDILAHHEAVVPLNSLLDSLG